MQPGEDCHIWLAFDDGIVDEKFVRSCESLLSPDERERRSRLRGEALKHQFLITRALLRRALSRYAPQVSPGDWRFETEEQGKPFIARELGIRDLHFNLAHTQGLVALAVARQPVLGVDVENMAARAPNLAIAARYFSVDEARLLEALPEADRARRFYALWTLKESWLKATGEGLPAGLGNVSFDLDADHRVLSARIAHDDARHWHFWQHAPSANHALALALRAPDLAGLRPVVRRFPEDMQST